eukprot:1182143-Prorocentrum_minimum.AAC.2
MTSETPSEFFGRFTRAVTRWKANKESTTEAESVESCVSHALRQVKATAPLAAADLENLLRCSSWEVSGKDDWELAVGDNGAPVNEAAQVEAVAAVQRGVFAHLVSATPLERKAEVISPEFEVEQTPGLEWDRQIRLAAAGKAPPGMMSAAQLKQSKVVAEMAELIRAGGFPSGQPELQAPGGSGAVPDVFKE